ncbi:hypothetical protein [Intestinimonas sp. HCP28S3_D6]|uniref:hypothetical protein n=1 Tax=Intestinimonas sp. HCP28S3_D6 TaxID=3438942 RepID=UPI003F8A6E7E
MTSSKVSFYELDFESGYGMVIKGTRDPSVEEAQDFISKHGTDEVVIGVFPISREEAENFYDFTYEENWPVFH